MHFLFFFCVMVSSSLVCLLQLMVQSTLQLDQSFINTVNLLEVVMLVKQSYLQGFFFLHSTLFVTWPFLFCTMFSCACHIYSVQIHTVGPIGEHPELLSKCYTSSLDLAVTCGIHSIVSPSNQWAYRHQLCFFIGCVSVNRLSAASAQAFMGIQMLMHVMLPFRQCVIGWKTQLTMVS